MSALTAILLTEAVARMCCIKKVFVKILQNSQENTCTRAFFNKVAGLRSFHKGPLFLFDINTCFLLENIEDLFSLANKIFDKTKIDSYVASIIESNMVKNKSAINSINLKNFSYESLVRWSLIWWHSFIH